VTDAEVVFFLNGLPKVSPVMCLSALVKSVASGLQEHIGDGSAIKEVRVGIDSVHVRGEGAVTVNLRFSPAFDSYRHALEVLGSNGLGMHPYPKWSLEEQRLLFAERQPEAVRVTMRLLKWWREQQQWSSAQTRPTNEFLELVAAYSALQSQASDQRDAFLAAMTLLTNFDQLRVIWPESSRCYKENDIPEPLLLQQPLFMDPVDPFVNIADPQTFDSSELMILARSAESYS